MKGDKSKKEQIEDNLDLICKGNIAKRYIKLKKINNIHHGEIFRVKSKITGEIYACKQIKRNRIVDIDKFLHEVSSLLKIDHPNIPKTIDIYDTPRFIYIIQEYIKGEQLFDLIINHISNGETFSEREALYFFHQIMSGLHCLHAAGINHKDIKPENIIVVENTDPTAENHFLVKLMDAGTSRIFGELKNQVSTLGKKGNESKGFNHIVKYFDPVYVPFESLQGNYEEKSDVWVAAVIFYQMLTGNSPWKGEEPNDILKAISRKRVTLKGVNFSDEAKEFFKKIFVDYGQRLSSQQVLDYEYVKNNQNAPNTNLQGFDIEKFKTFSKAHLMKKNIINLMVGCLQPEDILKFTETFESLKGEDGFITIQQLKDVITQGDNSSPEAQEKLKNYFDLLDLNGDGKIDYNEFLKVGLEQIVYFNSEILSQIFNMIDTDGNGYLTRDEMNEAVAIGKVSENLANQIFSCYDTNKDGKLSYEEFMNLLEGIGVKKEEEEEKKEAK